MEDKLEFRFGRIMCSTSLSRIREGKITNVKDVVAANDTLKLQRQNRLKIEWIADDHHTLVPTEEIADRVIDFLQQEYGNELQLAGAYPEDCMHGKIFFRKRARLLLADGDREQIAEEVAKILGCTKADISKLSYEFR